MKMLLLKFDSMLGDDTGVYLGSMELTALSGLKGAPSIARQYFDFLEKKECWCKGIWVPLSLEQKMPLQGG
jgi:hypothetical protein